MRLLYVDDEEDIRDVVDFALEDETDIEIAFASDGAHGIALNASFKPDLILLDVMMPGLDGPATFKCIREGAINAMVPIAFITAKVQREEVAHLRSLGAVEVIKKPFDPLTLPQLIRELLEKKA
jgi:two-component system, OmpR family, response regulator